MNKLINAKYIKALFIDKLLNQDIEETVIGSEVMFAQKKVVADLVLLSNGKTEAFEIKAKNDDLRKLKTQLEEYNKIFDFVSVIVTENHFEKAKGIINKHNGLIVISKNNVFNTYQEPKQNKNLNKEELLSTMTIKFILKYFEIPTNRNMAHEVRKSLTEKDIIDLRNALYLFFYSRITDKFNNFMLERGNKTHFEDVLLLSMPNKKVIL